MRHLLTLAILLIAISSFSQAPQGINYQAVAHDNSGEPLSGQTITVRIGILSSSASGTLEWEETHGVTTNSYGLFDLVVGMGSSTGGGNQANFSDINWGGTSHFMRVEVDGGSGFEAIGTTQLLSVPYALHAKTVENDQVDDADADATNELITGGTLNGTDLEITDAGGSTTIDLSPLNSSDTLPIIKDLITGSYVHASTGQSVEIGFSNTPYYTLDSNNRMTLKSNNGSLFVGSTPGGSNLTTGAANFGFGDGALQNVSTGYFNTAIAPVTLNSLTTGAENVAIGRGALSTITDGSGNIAFGYYALGEAGLGAQDNVAIGTNAGSNWTGGHQNIFIGYRAGAMVGTGAGNGNIKIGSNAGTNDSGNGKLYIGGHNGTTSLIYGNMLSDSLIINGSLSIGNEYTFPLTDGNPGEVLSTDGAGQLAWGPVSGDTDWSTGAGLIYNNTDLIGIGTVNPAEKLEVNGGNFFIHSGHIMSGGANPTVVNGTNGVNTYVSGTDVAGNCGGETLAFSGDILTINFISSYATVPNVILTATNANTAGIDYYVQTSTTGFTIILTSGVAGVNYEWNYMIIE